ncbi:MAG: DUF3562 domain-containing protein [Thermodesulfovibrionales bacterium]|nr:DUF3562 domain-containing protein [Thermodesulfovibrionales bacterium]
MISDNDRNAERANHLNKKEAQSFQTSDSDISLYEDEKERKVHFDAIASLVMKTGLAFQDVQKTYEGVLKEFKRTARIKDFLPVLVTRRVENLINNMKKSP